MVCMAAAVELEEPQLCSTKATERAASLTLQLMSSSSLAIPEDALWHLLLWVRSQNGRMAVPSQGGQVNACLCVPHTAVTQQGGQSCLLRQKDTSLALLRRVQAKGVLTTGVGRRVRACIHRSAAIRTAWNTIPEGERRPMKETHRCQRVVGA